MSDYNNNYEPNQSNQQASQQEPPQYQQPMYSPPQYPAPPGMEPPPGYLQKSRIAAGILAIIFGSMGIHSFYMGNTSRGLMQLLISIFGCGIGAIIIAIWGILDGIKILDGRINTDAYGIYFKD